MPRSIAAFAALGAIALALGCAATAPVDAPAPAPGAIAEATSAHAGDYLPAHTFKLEIDGVIVGGFKEGYRDGDDPITHKRPGKAKYKNIVLKRGFVADADFASWLDAAAKDPAYRKSGSVIYLDRESGEVVRTAFFEAWPVRYELKAMGDDLFVVSDLEMAVESEALKTRHDTAKNSVGNIR
jgi:phage tail-like protein